MFLFPSKTHTLLDVRHGYVYPQLDLMGSYLSGISIFSNTFHISPQPVECMKSFPIVPAGKYQKILIGPSRPCDYLKHQAWGT